MNDRFCANFLLYKGKIGSFIDLLDFLFYAIHCNNFFAFIIVALSAGGIFAILYLKAHSLFIKLAKIPLFFIFTTLFILSLIALFKDFSSAITPKDSLFWETMRVWIKREFFALAMRDYAFYTRNLFAVFWITVALYFATRYILGRQPTLKGDFWEHQNIAKSKVAWLNALFLVMLILICVCAFSLFQMVFLAFEINYIDIDEHISERIFRLKESLFLSAFFALAIWFAYLYKSFSMRNEGIDKLARILNADEILPSGRLKEVRENKKGKYFLGHKFAGKFIIKDIKRADLRNSKDIIAKNKTLFNVVSEMAIASNMPMPRVFVMQREWGINALCGGERFGYADEKIAIFVTQGALDNLTREELQGVVAHEFSHAFHGDVALNIKIYSLIFGLTWIMMMGEYCLNIAELSRSRTNNYANIAGAIVPKLIALVFYALGFLGSIFAQILQCAISRQKEFLADASSVQYTRNANGIKSALRRIKDLQSGEDFRARNIGAVGNIGAEPCAHMFFLDAMDRFFDKIFATHPSLEKRIRALNKIG